MGVDKETSKTNFHKVPNQIGGCYQLIKSTTSKRVPDYCLQTQLPFYYKSLAYRNICLINIFHKNYARSHYGP